MPTDPEHPERGPRSKVEAAADDAADSMARDLLAKLDQPDARLTTPQLHQELAANTIRDDLEERFRERMRKYVPNQPLSDADLIARQVLAVVAVEFAKQQTRIDELEADLAAVSDELGSLRYEVLG